MTPIVARAIALALSVLIGFPGPVATATATENDLLERRRMLTAEEHEPWKAVGRVNIATYGERGMCTGTLIAADLVITAAHCVVSARTGETYAPDSVHFVAGWRQGVKAAHSRAKSIVVHPGYRIGRPVDLERIGSDLALIRLSVAVPDDAVAPMPVAPVTHADGALTLISYRRDRAHALTRQDGCDLKGAKGAVIALGCDVTFGASGSPLFAEIDGRPRIVAVISAMGRAEGLPLAYAVRVDAAIAPVLAALD